MAIGASLEVSGQSWILWHEIRVLETSEPRKCKVQAHQFQEVKIEVMCLRAKRGGNIKTHRPRASPGRFHKACEAPSPIGTAE